MWISINSIYNIDKINFFKITKPLNFFNVIIVSVVNIDIKYGLVGTTSTALSLLLNYQQNNIYYKYNYKCCQCCRCSIRVFFKKD
jgi:hypothetical protein